MADEAIRCSKCGGTVSEGTCTACGATGQTVKCAHCGSVCPADAKWCPSCGRHLAPAASGEQQAPETMVSGGGNMLQLAGLLCLVVLLCVLILRAPKPAAAAVELIAIGFAAVPGTLYRRVCRVVPLLAGGALALGVVSLLPHSAVRTPALYQSPAAMTAAVPADPGTPGAPCAPGKIMVRSWTKSWTPTPGTSPWSFTLISPWSQQSRPSAGILRLCSRSRITSFRPFTLRTTLT
ncbi:MAG: zinc ribbon domain-containing protein [Chloroflexi bacterium]|nr:zinc ribbon domain-containing protein [Chloroflexota bacterium]